MEPFPLKIWNRWYQCLDTSSVKTEVSYFYLLHSSLPLTRDHPFEWHFRRIFWAGLSRDYCSFALWLNSRWNIIRGQAIHVELQHTYWFFYMLYAWQQYNYTNSMAKYRNIIPVCDSVPQYFRSRRFISVSSSIVLWHLKPVDSITVRFVTQKGEKSQNCVGFMYTSGHAI